MEVKQHNLIIYRMKKDYYKKKQKISLYKAIINCKQRKYISIRIGVLDINICRRERDR